jgi:putative phage-type endonuclease
MIPQQQGSEEWLEWRKNKIGASDASAIMGISPWKSAYQLWQEKIGLRDPEAPTDRMKRGLELEPIARQRYEEMTGNVVEPCVLVHPKHDWMIASLDGMSMDNRRFVEIKCVSENSHEIARQGDIPKHYYCQLQHQLAVAGLDSCHYFSFNGTEGVIVECFRDDDFINEMIEKEKEFHLCIENLKPPSEKYIERTDKEFENIVKQYLDTSAQIKWLSEQQENLRDKLIELTGGENCKGFGLKILKVVAKGMIKYKSIPELSGLDLDKYRGKPTETWKILQEK